MTGQPDAAREATEPSAAPWRVGTHYGIHVYEGDRPVATFHTIADAARAVADHNGAADRQRVAREAVSEALAEVDVQLGLPISAPYVPGIRVARSVIAAARKRAGQ